MSASIREFPDAGIIYALEDNYGDDGYADVHDVADVLGQENAAALGRRLGWMRRYGMVARHKHAPGRWRVTSKGDRAVKQATLALAEIDKARGVEFTLLRRTVQYRSHNLNGRK